MRMIDADALIERKCKTYAKGDCKHCTFWGDTWCDCNLTGMDLNNAPTLTQPNEWVNAEERLPEEGESVLCIVNGKPRKNITLCEAYQLGVWYKEDGWLIDEYLEWRDVEVLWWMPLPDAPEGEE